MIALFYSSFFVTFIAFAGLPALGRPGVDAKRGGDGRSCPQTWGGRSAFSHGV